MLFRSQGPAQRQTTSFRDKDEYRAVLGVLDILVLLFLVSVVGAVGKGNSADDENEP